MSDNRQQNDSTNWPVPSVEDVELLLSFKDRFKNERTSFQVCHVELPDDAYRKQIYEIHPATNDFFRAVHKGSWVVPGFDYHPWHDEHCNEYRDAKWISTLSLKEIQMWLTYFSRELRWSAFCIEDSISRDIRSGVLPALLRSLSKVRSQAVS
ncbi:hypothetical protein STSP2_01393 [Anaerohalosphaera lusitana]|uniref:Uncharacterized protein n=1 Tax=Anaerohalosphaera lusitana TaxID=1936003 RepID=A0A1U9NKA3_9BACT|nr:DUF6508 domain-containing protein [Anaerohalosphaera lusitana]AQT68237.1 hypothetical protein STSP2_01393 [Anaerohalosphaera lusitana]